MTDIEELSPFHLGTTEQFNERVQHIMQHAPVKNLTYDEVADTLRLIEIEDFLRDPNQTSRFSVTVWQDDKRLVNSHVKDQFMALLLDAECRGNILISKRCRYCFGQKPHYWQKVARESPIVGLKSMMVPGERGGRYFGRGWVIAPNIVTLRKWIVDNNLSTLTFK